MEKYLRLVTIAIDSKAFWEISPFFGLRLTSSDFYLCKSHYNLHL